MLRNASAWRRHKDTSIFLLLRCASLSLLFLCTRSKLDNSPRQILRTENVYCKTASQHINTLNAWFKEWFRGNKETTQGKHCWPPNILCEAEPGRSAYSSSFLLIRIIEALARLSATRRESQLVIRQLRTFKTCTNSLPFFRRLFWLCQKVLPFTVTSCKHHVQEFHNYAERSKILHRHIALSSWRHAPPKVAKYERWLQYSLLFVQ